MTNAGHINANRPLLLYLHIPKTGGTTLTDIICRQYSACIRCTDSYFSEDHSAEISTANAMCGHFLFGIHRHFSRQCTYITVLRDPVEQLISWFYFRYRSVHHDPYPASFEDYLEDPEAAAEFNLQTRFLAGGRPDLATAEYNLTSQLAFVGITELFDESLYLLKRQLQWGDVQYRPVLVNQSRPARDNLDSRLIRRIEETNSLDIRLYQLARLRLERQIDHLDAVAQREMSDLKHAPR